MDSAKVSAGEWWRIFTAVWLHADIGHLASNATTGFVFLGLAMGRYGTGAALLAAYLAGALGNVAGWALTQEPHRSLGASGMVMGALGLLATQSVALLPRASARIRYALAGALAGSMLFVLMGMSPETDVLAHAGGFAGGVTLGAVLARVPGMAENARVQLVAGLAFVLLAILPWWLAISRLRIVDG
jgi:membrane associated rhomboid family serine protease